VRRTPLLHTPSHPGHPALTVQHCTVVQKVRDGLEGTETSREFQRLPEASKDLEGKVQGLPDREGVHGHKLTKLGQEREKDFPEFHVEGSV